MLPASIGWALVFTNALSLVFMNLAGLFMERSVRRTWRGLLSFILLTYLLVPYQAYASLKGLLSPTEGGWHRTQKTGVITDVVDKLGLGKRMKKLLPKQKKSKKKKKKKGEGGIDIGRRLGGSPVAQVARRIPEPVKKRMLGLSPGMRLASGLAAILLLIGMAAVVLSGAEVAPNLAAAAIFVPIFASLATERRKMATRIISVVLSILLALALLSVQVAPVVAAPDYFYLHDTALVDGKDMDIVEGSGAASLDFNSIGQTAHWYSSQSYPTGNDDASLSAGNHTLNMYFGALPGGDWWDLSYSYRDQITITGNPDTAAGVGQTVRVTLDTATLVSAGKMLSGGDDVRLGYWNGSSWVEIDRQLFQMDTASTDIWFPLQATIADGAPDSDYYIYYGNSGATSPPTSLGTATTLEFYAGDGNANYQDATL